MDIHPDMVRQQMAEFDRAIIDNDCDLKRGDRVRFESSSDPYTKLQRGDLGTVTLVRTDPINGATVSVAWDSGSRLSMLLDEGDMLSVVH
jgi:hypothetical protein